MRCPGSIHMGLRLDPNRVIMSHSFPSKAPASSANTAHTDQSLQLLPRASVYTDRCGKLGEGNQCECSLVLGTPYFGGLQIQTEVESPGSGRLQPAPQVLSCQPPSSQKLTRVVYNTVQSWQLDFDFRFRRHHSDVQATCRERVSN